MDEEEYDAIFSFLEYGPSAWHHKDLKRAQVCGLCGLKRRILNQKKDKERGKIEYLQVPRGVEEIERTLRSCHSSKESEYMTAVHVYTSN